MKNNKSRPFKKNSHQGSPQSSGRNAGGRRSSNNNLATRSDSQISRDWRVVVGNHAIKEALSVSAKMVKMLWLKNSWEASVDLREIEEFARAKKVKIELKQDPVIDKFGASHQGAALFVDGAPS